MDKTIATAALYLVAASSSGGQSPAPVTDVFDRVTHGYAVSDGGVKIHYATLGQGPLVVMIGRIFRDQLEKAAADPVSPGQPRAAGAVS